MESIRLRPRIAPRSARDLARVLSAGSVLLVLILGIPALAAVLVHSLTGGQAEAWTVAIVAFWGIAIPGLATVVQEVQVGTEGLRFRRHAGSPKHLLWEKVRRIRPAGPGEVVLRGWLWPPFPPREATASLTAEGHYRIDYEEGFVFFPPEDPGAFLTAVEQWAPDVLEMESPSSRSRSA